MITTTKHKMIIMIIIIKKVKNAVTVIQNILIKKLNHPKITRKIPHININPTNNIITNIVMYMDLVVIIIKM
jgi:hypothetical protein